MRKIGLLLTTVFPALAFGAGYSITEVPLTPPPAGVTIPATASRSGACVAINDAGIAACNTVYSWKKYVNRFCCHYQSDYAGIYSGGALTPLRPVAGDTDTRAAAINSAGQVAGMSLYHLGIPKATVWTSTIPVAFGSGSATDINDIGQVVANGQLYDLATGQWTFPPYATTVTRINNSGVSIGWFDFLPGSGEDQGFTRSTAAPDDPQFLVQTAIPTYSDINSAGVVVATLTYSTPPSQALISVPGAPTAALEPYGAPSTVALAVNDSNVVAGGYGGRAAVWRAGVRTDLTAALGDASWVLTVANDINNSGVIVGEGLHNGQRRGFVLMTPLGATPPAPTPAPAPAPTPTPAPSPAPTPGAQACTGVGALELRGQVEDDNGALAGVTLALSGPGGCATSVATTTAGRYSFPGLAAGSYTLVPAKTGCSFTPSATTSLVTDTTDVGFMASCL